MMQKEKKKRKIEGIIRMQKNKQKKKNVEEDRISKLPDELIHHILSFIDTKYAVQTCVLSKRWIGIWKSLPFLDFDIKGFTTLDNLNDLIDRVFMLRHDCNIQLFRLRWRWYSKSATIVTTSVSRWIDTAVSHNVQEVTIELTSRYYGFTYEISPRLVNCKSLKDLSLRMFCEEDHASEYARVTLPQSMNLPLLKFMFLEGVSDVDLSNKLFSSCPVLEKLEIVECGIQTDNPGNSTVGSLSLKEFAYTYGHRRGFTEPKSIKLSAPCLESVTYRSSWTKDFYLEKNSSEQLSDVSFNILYSYEFESYQLPKKQTEVPAANRMLKLLLAVDTVKRLSLSSAFIEGLFSATNLENCRLPCLRNLQSLSLNMWITRDTLRAIAFLLAISPNIKTLILERFKCTLEEVGDDWEVGFPLAGMKSHLNFVRIENAQGCDGEIKILRFLLKITRGLKEVALYPCSTIASLSRLKRRFENKVKALSRDSSSPIKVRWGAVA